jgi:ABC-type multidrug transport system ATPase subunit
MISVKNLCKEFNGIKALDHVSIDIAKGETFGIVGPNGAGKTTLIRILTGQVFQTSGEIFFQGEVVEPRTRTYRLKIGLVPQEAAFYGRLSARENLELIGRLYGVEKDRIAEKATGLLDWSGLAGDADRQVRFFSRGMQQRLSLAMGLVHDPRLLYLDEPTSGLDPAARTALWGLIQRLSGEGTAILITTHNMEEADQLCRRLAVLVDGSIRKEGTPREIKGLMGNDRVELRVDLPDEGALNDLCERLDLSWSIEEGRLIMSGDQISRKIPEIIIALGPRVREVRQRQMTLDDAFMRFMVKVQ